MEKPTKKSQNITTPVFSGLKEEEIEKMKKEAEMFAEEDKKKKESVETRVNAESLVTQTERTLKDLGDKVPADVKTGVETKLKELKDALANTETSPEDLKTKHEALAEEIQKIGASMYQQPSAGTPADGASETSTDDPDVKVYEKEKKEDDKSEDTN